VEGDVGRAVPAAGALAECPGWRLLGRLLPRGRRSLLTAGPGWSWCSWR